MEQLKIQLIVSEDLYTKDPNSTDLGRLIITHSIELIHQLGFEAFTFKKLGEQIGSPESSIYRYFRSKNELLVYLVSWYWSWIEYKIVFSTTNIDDPKEKLRRSIAILTEVIKEDQAISYVNEVLLNDIVIREGAKTYHTKDVDSKNERGYYRQYKLVVQRVSNMISDINPGFAFPHMLVTTIIEGVHQQRYFAEHLPSLTDSTDDEDTLTNYYNQLVFRMIE